MPGLSVASGHDAVVDVPDGTGDPAGGRREQEGDRIGQAAGRGVCLRLQPRVGEHVVAGGADPAERVEAVQAAQGLLQLVLGDEAFIDGVATTAGATALTRMWRGARSMARLRVSACSPPLATEYADDGGRRDRLVRPHAAELTMDPPRPAATMHRTTVWVRKKIDRCSSR